MRIKAHCLFLSGALTCLLLLIFAGGIACADPPQKWALVIGIDRYKDQDRINDLSSAAKDARALKQTLIQAAGFSPDHVQLLVSDAAPDKPGEALPERSLILREVALLARRVHPGDLVFVAFSGHGILLSGKSYLLPYDADAYDDSTMTDSCIETATFQERLKKVAAGVLVLAFDMCRTSPLKTGREAIVPPNPLTADQVRGLDFNLTGTTTSTPGQNGPQTVVYLYSCREGQQSFEWTAKQRSYFSYYLEAGLRREAAEHNGAVHLDVLQSYLAQAVPDAVRTAEKKEQVPYFKVEGALPANRITLIEGVPDTNARLSLNVQPADAKVTVDGAPLTGNTIVRDLERDQEKEIELTVTAPDYETKIQKATLVRGKTVSLDVALVRLPPASFKRNPKDGAEMTLIPAGEFLMGNDQSIWRGILTNPRHTVRLSSYYIYKNLVTVGMYKKFCRATGHKMPSAPPFNPSWSKEDHPIVNVTWFDARSYCVWAGVQLPTEAQWERAARGTGGRTYPWGEEFDKSRLWCSDTHLGDRGGTGPVGSITLGATPEGVLDMAGNVWQWCLDSCSEGYSEGFPSDLVDPVNLPAPGRTARVLRGGSWLERDSQDFRGYYRFRKGPGEVGNVYGFRCAASVPR